MKLRIEGGTPLMGAAHISGSKNAALPILAATLLMPGTIVLSNVSRLSDIEVMRQILSELGVVTSWLDEHRLHVDSRFARNATVSADSMRAMRASYYVMGPLLARFGDTIASLPGGCAIGNRPIDLHLQAFQSFGAQTVLENGLASATTAHLRGAYMNLTSRFGPSVGATKNAMMAATMADGLTVIDNAAREPEVIDLARFLNAAGAMITGEGTSRIEIQGVSRLIPPAEYQIMSDRIEAGTFMIAAAVTGGDIEVYGSNEEQLHPLPNMLREMGARVEPHANRDGFRVCADRRLKARDIVTGVYPQFATDYQPLMVTLLTHSVGTSRLTETVFDGRFGYVRELNRLGAQIEVEGNTAIIQGGSTLYGKNVVATDLRAGAALLVAGLAAQGTTTIEGADYLRRGYECIAEKWTALGGGVHVLD